MKSFIRFLFVYTAMYHSATFAGQSEGFVTNLLFVDDGRIIFQAGEYTGAPNCVGTSDEGTWEFKTNSANNHFKEILLSAQDNHQRVTVMGKDSCAFGGRELVYYIKK